MAPWPGTAVGSLAMTRVIVVLAVMAASTLPARAGIAKDGKDASDNERRYRKQKKPKGGGAGGGGSNAGEGARTPPPPTTPEPVTEADFTAMGLQHLQQMLDEADLKLERLVRNATEADRFAAAASRNATLAEKEAVAAKEAMLSAEAALVEFGDDSNRKELNRLAKANRTALNAARHKANRTAAAAVAAAQANRSAHEAVLAFEVNRTALLHAVTQAREMAAERRPGGALQASDTAPASDGLRPSAPAFVPKDSAEPIASPTPMPALLQGPAFHRSEYKDGGRTREDIARDHSHDHGEEDPEGHVKVVADENGWLMASKWIAILVMIASAVLGVGLRATCPALSNPECFGMVNVLAGGMFIAMGMFHILPETIDHAPSSMKTMFTTSETSLSVMMWCVFGFLVVLLFDRVVSSSPGCGGNDEIDEEALKHALNPRLRVVSGGGPASRGSSFARAPRLTSGGKEVELSQDVQRSVAESHASADGNGQSHAPARAAQPAQQTHMQSEPTSNVQSQVGGHGHAHGLGIADASIAGAAFLALSLSFHAIFEGVVVGTAEETETVWLLLVVIAAHKWAEVLAIANQLTCEQRLGGKACTLLGIFSLASPLGVAIGWAVAGSQSEWSMQVECMLNAFAVGALLYVGMVEVIPEEFSGSRHMWRKFFLLLVGVGVMLLMSLFHLETAHVGDGHAHTHSHGHGHSHTH
mmetsp:Transcript_39343/g.113883  ORF Transcript_39343/g.113883 Transcript_39343/m.113883 type:complete len:701 (-) Transcript_39343:65-2167(-)